MNEKIKIRIRFSTNIGIWFNLLSITFYTSPELSIIHFRNLRTFIKIHCIFDFWSTAKFEFLSIISKTSWVIQLFFINKLTNFLLLLQEPLVVMKHLMMIRRRQKKQNENDWKPSERLKNAEKRSTVKWKKNERRCVKKLETKWVRVSILGPPMKVHIIFIRLKSLFVSPRQSFFDCSLLALFVVQIIELHKQRDHHKLIKFWKGLFMFQVTFPASQLFYYERGKVTTTVGTTAMQTTGRWALCQFSTAIVKRTFRNILTLTSDKEERRSLKEINFGGNEFIQWSKPEDCKFISQMSPTWKF